MYDGSKIAYAGLAGTQCSVVAATIDQQSLRFSATVAKDATLDIPLAVFIPATGCDAKVTEGTGVTFQAQYSGDFPGTSQQQITHRVPERSGCVFRHNEDQTGTHCGRISSNRISY